MYYLIRDAYLRILGGKITTSNKLFKKILLRFIRPCSLILSFHFDSTNYPTPRQEMQ